MKTTTIENSTDVSWIIPEFYDEMLKVKDLYNWTDEQINIVNNHISLVPKNGMIGFHKDRKRVFVSLGVPLNGNIVEITIL